MRRPGLHLHARELVLLAEGEASARVASEEEGQRAGEEELGVGVGRVEDGLHRARLELEEGGLRDELSCSNDGDPARRVLDALRVVLCESDASKALGEILGRRSGGGFAGVDGGAEEDPDPVELLRRADVRELSS